jgi:diacylglycerol kinase (ATP)
MTTAVRPHSQRSSAERVLVVWNPAAGSKAGLPTNGVTEDELRATMRAAGLGDDLFAGETEEATRERIREAVESGVEVVVAAGGDGTAGLVAGAIIGTPATLGILPLGSAMNIARSLGIPRDLSAAAEVLATGEIATVDVGRASDGLFFEMASVGIDAAVLGEAHKLAEGSYRSIFGLLRAIVVYRPATMTIELDLETVRTGALMIVVANTPFTGAGLTLAPDARMDDGLFDVAVYRHFSRWELVRHGLSIIAGRRSYSPKVRTYRSATVRIDARRPLPARADARDLGTTPLALEIVPSALRVIVPRSTNRAAPEAGGPALVD